MMQLDRALVDRLCLRLLTITGQRGFTLIELLVVMVLVAVLLVIAVPSYLGFRARATDAATKASIRAAIPAVEMFAADNTGTKGDSDNKPGTIGYKGMTAHLLRTKYDAGIANALSVVSGKTTATSYCLTMTEGGRTWSALGPGISDTSFKNNKNCK
jgi:prepilin-type N-terminal cleavage/methylation domain-containing protein